MEKKAAGRSGLEANRGDDRRLFNDPKLKKSNASQGLSKKYNLIIFKKKFN